MLAHGAVTFAGSGGAVSAGDAVSVEASTLSGNESFTNGGAIRAGAGVVALTNSTVSGNKASQDGGGLWADGSVDLRHVTLVDNVAASGGNLYIDNGAATLSSFGSVLGRSNTDNCVVSAGGTSRPASTSRTTPAADSPTPRTTRPPATCSSRRWPTTADQR